MVKSIIGLILIFSLTGCTQLLEMARMQQCTFKFKNVSSIKLSNINFQSVNSLSNITFANAAKLALAYSSGNLPLTFNINLEAKNPNTLQASMNRLDWIAIIDNAEIARGTINQNIQIPANNIATKIPVSVSVNLIEILSGKSKTAILNYAMNLAGGNGQNSRVKVKIKPSIKVGTSYLPMPGYLTLSM